MRSSHGSYPASHTKAVEMRLEEEQRSDCEGSASGGDVIMVKGFASGPFKGGASPKRPGDERWNGPGDGQGPALRR